MRIIRWLVIVTLVLALAAIGAGQAGFLEGERPAGLGVTDGKLAAPLPAPNSVSSQADLYPGHPQQAYARIDALAFTGDGAAAMAGLATLLQKTSSATVVEVRPDYIYAQFQTPVMHFVDDVEFWLNPQRNVIEVRSASRLGKSDLGTNRKRIEAIRSRFKP